MHPVYHNSMSQSFKTSNSNYGYVKPSRKILSCFATMCDFEKHEKQSQIPTVESRNRILKPDLGYLITYYSNHTQPRGRFQTRNTPSNKTAGLHMPSQGPNGYRHQSRTSQRPFDPVNRSSHPAMHVANRKKVKEAWKRHEIPCHKMVDVHSTETKNNVHHTLRRRGLSWSPLRSLCVKYAEIVLCNSANSSGSASTSAGGFAATSGSASQQRRSKRKHWIMVGSTHTKSWHDKERKYEDVDQFEGVGVFGLILSMLNVKYTVYWLNTGGMLRISEYQWISFAHPAPPEGMITTHSTTRPPSEFSLGILQFPWHLQRPDCAGKAWDIVGTRYIRVSRRIQYPLIHFIISFMVFSTHITAVPWTHLQQTKKQA